MRQFLFSGATIVSLTAAAWGARHETHRNDVAASRPIVTDDTTAVQRLLRISRGVDPLVCEMVVRNVDMHGWWSRGGDDALAIDSTSAATVRWIQDEHNDPRLVPSLTAALRDPDGCTRRVAGSFLGRIDHPSARSALTAALDDASAGTREVAAIGLGLAEDHGAIRALVARLHDDNADVRRASAWALGSIEDSTAVAPLIVVLQHDSDPRVRQVAAWAIGNAAKQ